VFISSRYLFQTRLLNFKIACLMPTSTASSHSLCVSEQVSNKIVDICSIRDQAPPARDPLTVNSLSISRFKCQSFASSHHHKCIVLLPLQSTFRPHEEVLACAPSKKRNRSSNNSCWIRRSFSLDFTASEFTAYLQCCFPQDLEREAEVLSVLCHCCPPLPT
jgi:hypothetical protein